jgi:hypothetical protein
MNIGEGIDLAIKSLEKARGLSDVEQFSEVIIKVVNLLTSMGLVAVNDKLSQMADMDPTWDKLIDVIMPIQDFMKLK